MEEKDKEKYRLKIFLVKDEFFDEDLLKEGVENIENFLYFFLIVLYKKYYGKASKWFTSLFGQADIGIMLSGISGYFTKKIQVSEDIFKQFVITFGGAEKYLKQEYFDQTFGRRIALNLEDGFYQIKRAKISTTQAKTREDATKRKMLGDFDIEYGLDLITSVVVNPKENSFIEGKTIERDIQTGLIDKQTIISIAQVVKKIHKLTENKNEFNLPILPFINNCKRKSLLHFDLTKNNILKSHNDKINIIDFDDAKYGESVCDIAILIANLFFSKTYGVDLEGMNEFINEYYSDNFELRKIEEPLIKKYALEWIKYTLDGHEFSASLTESFKVKYKLISDRL